MSKDKRLSLRVENDTWDSLRELARELGFLSVTGKYVGQPSVSAMIDALASAYRARPETVAEALLGENICR